MTTTTEPDMTWTIRTAALQRTARTVALALDRSSAGITAVGYDSTPDRAEHARRAERLCQLYTRRARWWTVLERATITDTTIPSAYMRAVVHARCIAQDDAWHWARNAEQWQQLIDTDSTADAADAAGRVPAQVGA